VPAQCRGSGRASPCAGGRVGGDVRHLVIESSPGNYHGWGHLSATPLLPDLATAAARELAEQYGGDLHAADWCHYGRLAGFTNRKPERARADGRPPFVLVRDAGGWPASAAAGVLERAGAVRGPDAGKTRPGPQQRPVDARTDAQAPSFSRPQAGVCRTCRASAGPTSARRPGYWRSTPTPARRGNSTASTNARSLCHRPCDAASITRASAHCGSAGGRLHVRGGNWIWRR